MLMLALLPIGLLALRCVDTLATRFGDLLFNFFVLIISSQFQGILNMLFFMNYHIYWFQIILKDFG